MSIDEDDLIRTVQDMLLERMRDRDVDIRELARHMDLDHVIVARMFTPAAPTLTVRRLAAAAYVLGLSLGIQMVDAD